MPQFLVRVWKYLFLFAFIFASSISSVAAQNLDTLNLRQFLRTIIATHPLLQSAAFERNIADAELQSALGGFDPVIRAGYDLKYEASQSSPDKINHLVTDVELPLNTLFGPKVMAGFERGIGSSLNPEERTASAGQAMLGLSLPLWSGVATDRRRTNYEKARLRPLLADANQRFEQNNLLRAAATQFWSWSEALEQVRIAENVLTISVQRAAFISARARRGEVAALDSVEAMQEVERRRGDLFRARRTLEQANIDASVFFWTEAGLPRALSQSPQSLPELPNLDSLQARADRDRAMALRPEMQRLDFNQQSTTLDLNLAREGQKPFIEAKTQWLYYPERGSADNFKLGLNFSLPVFFRAAGAQAELFTISLERTRLQIAQTSRFINAEIDNAVSALQRAAERVEAAEKEARYAFQMEEGERKRFFAGETTLLIVNLRERAAAEARVRVVSAKADYLRAWILYNWATGDIVRLAQ
ncbi:MAG: TolC family protein [Candidatus Kapabacteria bacterium]|nr:TolC family protein [Candidatus Kapabacteria bacterium]